MPKEKLYMNKANRDAEVKRLETEGYKVSKTRVTNQQLHPEYVEDYPSKVDKEDNGFGNVLYKTYFKVLYTYVIKDSPLW